MSENGLHVLSLEAKQFLGLRVLKLDIGEDGVVLSGDNGSGKTSALSILETAIGGAKSEPKVPIHAGAFRAEIGVVLGRDKKAAYRVEKEWETGKSARLHVMKIDEHGVADKVTAPQKILDGFYEALGFDVGEFIDPPGAKTPEAKAKEQVATLLRACPIALDLDAVAKERKRLYDERSDVKRDGERVVSELRLKAKIDVPERVDLDAKRATLRQIQSIRQDQRTAAGRIAGIDTELEELRQKFGRLKAERETLVTAAQTVTDDPSALEAAISAGERQNEERIRIAAGNERYDELLKSAGGKKRRADELTAAIEALDQRKIEALAAASFPVPGLGVDEALGVTFAQDGAVVPFAQLNTARKIEIAFRVLAKLNPTLRVAIIRDGNSLDNQTLGALRRTAAVLEFQLMIERVAADQVGAIVFEDGAVSRVVGKEIA